MKHWHDPEQHCYFGAEACRRGHAPDCPHRMYMSERRQKEFFGRVVQPLTSPLATPMPSAGEEDTLPALFLRPTTELEAAMSSFRVHGGYLTGMGELA